MKVLMITPSYFPIKGGTENVVRNLTLKLNKVGINTDVLTYNMNEKWNPKWKFNSLIKDNYTLYRIPGFNWFPFRHSDRFTLGINLIPGQFKNIFKRYDLLHFHGADLSLPFFSYLVKKPKIFHSHGFSKQFYQKYHLNRHIFKNIADIYLAITHMMLNEFIELGFSKNKIRYLPNAIDINDFVPIKNKQKNLILFVGRITYSKGIHILLDSLKYIKDIIELVIIGPPDWDKKYFDFIMSIIKVINEKGIHHVVYKGSMDISELKIWYQKANILVLPTAREAFSMVVLEALSCETNVISTHVGGLSEVLENGYDSILINDIDSVKLGKEINTLMDDESLAKKLAKNGRIKVVNNYSLENAVNMLINIYDDLI